MSKQKERGAALISALDDVPPAPTQSRTGSARPDSSVPALGMVGELARDELRLSRERVAELQAQLDTLIASGTIQRLDPKKVTHTQYRDRDELGFHDKAYEDLKEDIRRKGRNEQPILVRPARPDSLQGGFDFEVVWGHRRHRVTQELGIPVEAIVREVSDRDAVLLMSSENARREGLSQYEQARKYRTWIRAGLFENMVAIADAECVHKSTIGRIMAINDLPDEVFAALKDPRSVTGLFASKLLKAIGADENALDRVKSADRKMSPAELLKLVAPPLKALPAVEFKSGGRRIFSAVPVESEGGSKFSEIRLHVDLDQGKLERLADFVSGL
ncbi:ParB/RepB/Spo0J family partition protein (plasmid) [Xanthomonas sontii]|uniref:ParB/RepB/Spo0J family partition protein n=1 Tax=Xanthomonas sontii TaxID=2650745 RepID=UPI003F85F462